MHAQDEFIDKVSNQVSDFTLKIKSITKDSLIYKAFGKTKQIPLSDIYCYHYKKNPWVFVDSIYKKYGYVSNGSVGLIYKRPEFILKPYYHGVDSKMIDFRQDYDVIFHLDSNKTRTLKDNREVSFNLLEDSLNALFTCNLHKIISDTLVIKSNYGFDNKVKYWKIPFNKISNIYFQTNAQKAVKISSGIVFSALTMGLGGGLIPGIKIKSKFEASSDRNYEFIKDNKKE